MKTTLTTFMLFAMTGGAALAQTPTSAVPPATAGQHAQKTTSDVANGPTSAAQTPRAGTAAPGSAIPPSSNAPVTRHVIPAPSSRYNSGTAEVGNSTDANGILGSSGASASATMQGGHLNNR